MTRRRKALVFLLFAVFFAAVAYGVLGREITEIGLNIAGQGTGNITQSVYDMYGNIYALSNRNGYEVLISNRDGTSARNRISGMSKSAVISDIFADEGLMYVTAYETDEDGGWYLVLYSGRDGKMDLVLREACKGESLSECKAYASVSGFSQSGGTVRFFVKTGDNVDIYSVDSLEIALVGLGSFKYEKPIYAGIVTTDGTAYIADEDKGLLYLKPPMDKPELAESGHMYSRLTQAVDHGLNYIDKGTGDVMHYSPGVGSIKADIENISEIDNVTYIYPGQESALVIKNWKSIYEVKAQGQQYDITKKFYRPVWQNVLILCGVLLAVMILSYGLYCMFCKNKRYMPLVLTGAIVLSITSGVFGTLAFKLYIEPRYTASVEQAYLKQLKAEAQRYADIYSLNDETDLDYLWQPVEGFYADIIIGDKTGGLWRIDFASDPSYRTGELIEISGKHLAESVNSQAAMAVGTRDEKIYTASAIDKRGMAYIVYGSPQKARQLQMEKELKGLGLAVYASSVLAGLSVLLLIWSVVRGIKRIHKGVRIMAGGGYDVSIINDSGDELWALTQTLGELSNTVRSDLMTRENQDKTYMRFVPEKALSLLGAKSVRDIKKDTQAFGEMIIMKVNVSLQKSQFCPSDNDKDRPKEMLKVLSKTVSTAAAIAEQKGIVYNLGINGFEAVFKEADDAISTAVEMQKNVTENVRDKYVQSQGTEEVKDKAGKEGFIPEVQAALWKGSAAIGVIEGGNMVPTLVTEGQGKLLIDMCKALEAGILCTMEIAEAKSGKDARYIGKAKYEDGLIRVYELFCADVKENREDKEKTRNQFSEGVLTFYTRDYARAKQIFSDLSRYNSRDGVSKRYLHLAEKYEKEQPEEVSIF